MVKNKNEIIPIVDKALNVEKCSILDWLILHQGVPQDGTEQAKKGKTI